MGKVRTGIIGVCVAVGSLAGLVSGAAPAAAGDTITWTEDCSDEGSATAVAICVATWVSVCKEAEPVGVIVSGGVVTCVTGTTT